MGMAYATTMYHITGSRKVKPDPISGYTGVWKCDRPTEQGLGAFESVSLYDRYPATNILTMLLTLRDAVSPGNHAIPATPEALRAEIENLRTLLYDLENSHI